MLVFNYLGGVELKKLRKSSLVFIIFTLLISSISMTLFHDSAQANIPFDIEAESAMLIEAKTGKIIFQKNPDVALPPASMSKMMTEYLVLEAISEGHFDWDTVTSATTTAHFYGGIEGTSRVWLAEGEERTVRELYTALAVYSANDATVALAELVSGTETSFVELMNEKAQELGMTNTHFVNSTGLPNSLLGNYIAAGAAEDENLMSARDTAILARALVNNFPEILEFSSIPEKPAEYFNVRLINFNWMLEGNPDGRAKAHTYPEVDGLKTGFTELAQYCFTGTAEKNGMRLISVVMRSESKDSRFAETRKLLDYGFNNFVYKKVVSQGTVVEGIETLSLLKGKEKEVPVAVGEDLVTLIHKDEDSLYTLEYVPNPEYVDEEGRLMAPIAKGDVVGDVKLVYSGEIGYDFIQGENPEGLTLVAQEDVEKAGWFRLFMRAIADFFVGIWVSISEGIKGWFS
jgi:D-alanyl-D-alanine carboxypeptidase (penicillin-binding protein 5/6)